MLKMEDDQLNVFIEHLLYIGVFCPCTLRNLRNNNLAERSRKINWNTNLEEWDK